MTNLNKNLLAQSKWYQIPTGFVSISPTIKPRFRLIDSHNSAIFHHLPAVTLNIADIFNLHNFSEFNSSIELWSNLTVQDIFSAKKKDGDKFP